MLVLLLTLFTLFNVGNTTMFFVMTETDTQMNMTVGGTFDVGALRRITPPGSFLSGSPGATPGIAAAYGGYGDFLYIDYCSYGSVSLGATSWTSVPSTETFLPSSGFSTHSTGFDNSFQDGMNCTHLILPWDYVSKALIDTFSVFNFAPGHHMNLSPGFYNYTFTNPSTHIWDMVVVVVISKRSTTTSSSTTSSGSTTTKPGSAVRLGCAAIMSVLVLIATVLVL